MEERPLNDELFYPTSEGLPPIRTRKFISREEAEKMFPPVTEPLPSWASRAVLVEGILYTDSGDAYDLSRPIEKEKDS